MGESKPLQVLTWTNLNEENQSPAKFFFRHLEAPPKGVQERFSPDPLSRIIVEQTSTKIEVAFPSASVGMCDPWIINGSLISICWSVEQWAEIRGTEFGYEVILIGKLVLGGETYK